MIRIIVRSIERESDERVFCFVGLASLSNTCCGRAPHTPRGTRYTRPHPSAPRMIEHLRVTCVVVIAATDLFIPPRATCPCHEGTIVVATRQQQQQCHITARAGELVLARTRHPLHGVVVAATTSCSAAPRRSHRASISPLNQALHHSLYQRRCCGRWHASSQGGIYRVQSTMT
jgi:hypothetical protein